MENKEQEQNYYDIPAISASQIKKYADSPFDFWKSTPLNPDRPEQQVTPALTFGKLVHCLLLEPEEFEKDFVIRKDDFLTMAEQKKQGVEVPISVSEQKEQFEAENKDKNIVTYNEVEKAQEMVERVKKHKLANAIITGLITERPFFMKDEATGLPLKGKVDGIKKLKSGKIIIVDYKTCADIEKAKEFHYKGLQKYHLQAAIYIKLVRARYPEAGEIEFIFILQEKNDIEKVACFTYNPEDPDRANDLDIVENTQLSVYLEEIKNLLNLWNEGNKEVWDYCPEMQHFKPIPDWYFDNYK